MLIKTRLCNAFISHFFEKAKYFVSEMKHDFKNETVGKRNYFAILPKAYNMKENDKERRYCEDSHYKTSCLC